EGQFTQRGTGRVDLQLGGTNPGTEFDQIIVTGHASLDGTLDVSRTGGFTPVNGDSFEILRFDTRFCDFLTKTGLDLGGGLYLAASFDLTSMSLNAGTTPDSGQQCETIPQFSNVDVGPDPAKVGDVLSVTFEVDVPLASVPTATVDGNAASLSSQNGSLYTFVYSVTGTETEGVVDVVLEATSLDGGIATEVIQTELDFTAPVITSVTSTPSPADVGTVLTVTFQSSEPLDDSTIVRIGGQPATRIASPGYSYSRLLTGDEGLGTVTVDVAAVDLAGNTGSGSGTALIVSGGFDVSVNGINLSNDRPGVGTSVTSALEVHNSGLFDAVDVPVLVTLIDPTGSETVLMETTLDLIAAGGSSGLELTLTPSTTGVYVLRLTVDPENVIPEISELDNVATRSLIVEDTPPTVISVTGALSSTQVAPVSRMIVEGDASWLAELNAAGAVAGGLVSLNVPGTFVSGGTLTNSAGRFRMEFDAPVAPGNYLARITVSDRTTDSLLILPFTVTAPVGGVNFYTNNGLVGVSDSTPIVNSPVTVQARIYNSGGDDFSGTTDVHFYDGDTLIGTRSIAGLASQESVVVSISPTFTSPGIHTLTAVVDEAALVAESVETDNRGTVQINVLNNVPDLTATDLIFSDTTPVNTDSVSITAKIVNQGGSSATAVQVQFFDGAELIGAAAVPIVAGDGGVAFATVSTVFATAGVHEITVVIDPDSLINEIDETNNSRTESIIVHAPTPDLVSSPVSLSNATPLAGETVTISMPVSNSGEAAAASFVVEFRKDGVLFDTVTVATLAAGESTIIAASTTFSVVGPHVVTVTIDPDQQVTELSELNNSASRTLQVLATPLPDLRIDGTEFSLSDSNPLAGETVTVTVPIRNAGLATADSVTAQLQIDGVVVGSASAVPDSIAAGQSATWTLQFTAPAGDGFHLLEIVVDHDNVIGESNENNNRDFLQFLVGAHPDLAPSSLTFSNTSPLEGDVVTISAVVTNAGDATAAAFVVRFLDGSQQIGQTTVSGLISGESVVVDVPFNTTGKTGLRLIQVIVDPADAITEINEGNNLISRNLSVAPADAVAPVTTATPSIAANAAGWNSTDVDVLLSAADNVGGSGFAYLRYSVDGGPVQTTLDPTPTIGFSSEGIHTLTFQAVDFAQNAEALQTLTVRIDRTAPVAAHAGPWTIAEGSSLVLDGTESNDGLSGIDTINWAIDADGLFNDGAIVNFTAPDGPFTKSVALQVTDRAGNTTTVVTEIVVTNVAPTANAGNDVHVAEGASVALSGVLSSDPGGDIATYEWDLDGDGIYGETGAAALRGDEAGVSVVFSAAALDGPSDVTVSLKVTDEQGASNIDTVILSIDNVAPAFEAGPDASLVPADSGSLTRSLTFTDPALADVHTATISYGDGTTETLTIPVGDRTFTLNHVYSAEGQFTIAVTLQDDDGGSHSDSFLTDVVLNTAPEAPVDADGAVNEVPEGASPGTSVGLTASAFDADNDEIIYSLTDDAGGRFRIDSATGVVSVSNGSLLDGPADHTVVVRATDPFGMYAESAFAISVRNVAPTASDASFQLTENSANTTVVGTVT
ncbi:MAG: hypothetical protein KDA96_15075, partial [Planctomycetaceae bacterium]|nr:hypothetical protein [Planctomycetaceae bacterium]